MKKESDFVEEMKWVSKEFGRSIVDGEAGGTHGGWELLECPNPRDKRKKKECNSCTCEEAQGGYGRKKLEERDKSKEEDLREQ